MTQVRRGHPAAGGRTGRRPGRPDTKQAIVAAAAELFAEQGFSGATLRSIGARAGVDAALVHHYFGSKRELFIATVAVPFDPAEVVEVVAAGDPATIGIRLVAALLRAWDDPAAQPALVALIRSALADPALLRPVREFVGAEIIGRLLRAVRTPASEAPLRAALIGGQVVGLLVGRYVLRLPALADLPAPVLVTTVGPVLQGYLTGPLPALPDALSTALPTALPTPADARPTRPGPPQPRDEPAGTGAEDRQ